MSHESPSALGRFPRTTQEAFGTYARFDVPRPSRNRGAYAACIALVAVILAVVLAGCVPGNSRPRTPIADQSNPEFAIEIYGYDMKDGVRCYTYARAPFHVWC